MVDLSTPLIEFVLRERKVYEPTLQTEWLSGSETVDLDNEVQERLFIELEHPPGLNLSTGVGSPPGNPDPYSFHYQLRRQFFEHSYRSQREFANIGPTADYNNFYGWYHNASLYNRTEYWTDDHVATFVWQLRSRPSESEPAQDKIVLFNSAGDVISSSTVSEATTQVINVGRTWGVRAEASDNALFEMRSTGGVTINNFSRHAGYTIPAELAAGMPSLPDPEEPNLGGLQTLNPHSMTHPFIRITTTVDERPYFENTTIDPGSGLPIVTPVIKVLAQVNVFTFGAYWIQDMTFVNTYDQGVLLHPPSTADNIRLKPPGKSYFSDDFGSGGGFTDNAEWR